MFKEKLIRKFKIQAAQRYVKEMWIAIVIEMLDAAQNSSTRQQVSAKLVNLPA